jgi:signal transduction histidine kinase
MLVALAIAFFASRALSQPLVQLADLSRRLTRGDFQERAPRHLSVPELDDLALAFNRLTGELRARLAELGRERDEMQALIDCMAEGVVALTGDARVFRTNRAARALLDLPRDLQDAPVETLVRQPELRRALEESVYHPVSSREIRIGDRHLLVSSRRLDLGGAVTTLLDISEIRRLEQVRRDFVANASHELKTPLTSIRGFAETLLEDDPPDELRVGFLRSMRENTLRLQRLVDDLLDLSRLESGGWVADPEPVLVSEAARDTWTAYSELAAGRDIAFDVDADAKVLADRRGLAQVLRNLLENAVRHTDRGGHVHVGARLGEDGMVEIEVSDDGEGIPSKALPRIFERFYRADSSRARDFGGTGLGLAIVRHLVEVMGGSVSAESELGRGTTIRLRLPSP